MRAVLALILVVTAGGFLALIYARAPGSRADNQRAYELGKTHPQGAIDIFSAQIAGDPQNFAHYLRRGLTYEQMRNYDAALADFNEAIRLNPNKNTNQTLGARVFQSTVPETHLWQLDVQTHAARADVLLQLGRLAPALADIDYVVAVNRHVYSYRQARGRMRILAAQYDDAIADFDEVLRHGVNVEALFARGFAKYLKHDWRGAAADFERSMRVGQGSAKYADWLAKSRENAVRPANFNAGVIPAEEIERILAFRRDPREP